MASGKSLNSFQQSQVWSQNPCADSGATKRLRRVCSQNFFGGIMANAELGRSITSAVRALLAVQRDIITLITSLQSGLLERGWTTIPRRLTSRICWWQWPPSIRPPTRTPYGTIGGMTVATGCSSMLSIGLNRDCCPTTSAGHITRRWPPGWKHSPSRSVLSPVARTSRRKSSTPQCKPPQNPPNRGSSARDTRPSKLMKPHQSSPKRISSLDAS
jgi:hypothetical protein